MSGLDNLAPHQFGQQQSLFDARHLMHPHAPATGPIGGPAKPRHWDTATDNRHGVYLRFGDWPHDERSNNNVTGGKEEGVSVYSMGNTHAEPHDPDPRGERGERYLEHAREWHHEIHGPEVDFDEDDVRYGDSEFPGNDTGQEMMGRRNRALRDHHDAGGYADEQRADRRGHFVRGTLTGFGHDDEPLLQNLQHLGSWPQHAHRFVTGTQEELFPPPGSRFRPNRHVWG